MLVSPRQTLITPMLLVPRIYVMEANVHNFNRQFPLKDCLNCVVHPEYYSCYIVLESTERYTIDDSAMILTTFAIDGIDLPEYFISGEIQWLNMSRFISWRAPSAFSPPGHVFLFFR